MKSGKIKYIICYMLYAFLFASSSCSDMNFFPLRKPIKIYPNFQDVVINSIYLMPVVDRRYDRSVPYPFEGFEFSTMLTGTVYATLKNKGYKVRVNRTSTGSYNSLGSMESKSIKSKQYEMLGSDEDNYILIIFLDEVTSGRSAWSVKASGVLYSKILKASLWEDKISEQGAGIVSSIAEDGIKNLLLTLPDNFIGSEQ